jgi:hypothetical protein
VKKVFVAAVALMILVSACSKQSGKVIVLSWQRPEAAACQGCDKCGITEQDIQKAATELKSLLADKGVKVVVKPRAALKDKTIAASACNVWVCDIPLETWLAASVNTHPCEGQGDCQKMMHKALFINGNEYTKIPPEFVVKAGFLAAEMLMEKGKIDPANIKTPKGCAGCPSAGVCGGMK